MRSIRAAVLLLGFFAVATPAVADEIAAADLQIQGVGLKVVNVSVATGLNIPAAVQTEFGGKQNDQAPVVEGLLAVGELSGPGIDVPIRLETAPGQKFQIPGLQREGIYFLQNIRLMKGDDFLQPATPAVATITVSNLLQTTVKVKQLTAEEIRARGISVDARNYDVYEYTFSFLVDGVTVEIPFPVIIDPRTHEVRQVPEFVPWTLPPVHAITPPRWFPPDIMTFEMAPPPEEEPATRDDPVRRSGTGRITIPAALVIPNNLAVLHQFFAVTLMVTNGAPEGSTVSLDDITAVIKPPAQLRTVKSIPSVAFNQPVPIVDATTGVRFLVAQARGDAEWTMEGLATGTHTLEVEVKATYKSPGQVDFPLKGTARASVVVHDPRFNVNFSHPDTVRKDIEYSTYSFITNMSPALQNIRVSNGLPACAEAPGANVCRVDGTPAFHDLTIPAGEMRSIEYKLRPGITGNVFATAGSVEGDAVTAQVALHMGVSESGIPLSPATLLMPYYARFVGQPMVNANLQLLGLGYSLATAPMSAALAKHPRIIKPDVYRRATDIARAGQRVFLGEPMRDSLAHMTLDLLGNALELREWDDLRRQEKSGRTGAASIARELEAATTSDTSVDQFVASFAKTTAWRAPYLLAVTSTGKLSVRDAATNARMDVASEATSGWVRQLPWGEIDTFRGGELAVVGRWSGNYEVTVTPAADGPFTLDLILPATNEGSVLRAQFNVTTAQAGKPLKVLVTKGATALDLRDELGGVASVGLVTTVTPAPLAIIGARQDLNLDAGGHKVSILWNRPVTVTGDLLAKLAAQVVLDKEGVHYQGARPMSAAALQEGGRVANVTFDHALSVNASYTMTVGSLTDPLSGASASFPGALVPVIDNNAPGGIIYGHVLKGDNTPIGDAEVRLLLEGDAGPPQYDSSRASDGAFLFEFVPRDIDNNLPGTYTLEAVTTDLKTTSVEGAVRLPGRVHLVNLVFLGRGSAEGTVRYDNGEVVPKAKVVIGSTMFDQFRTAEADANGRYKIEDLPVGPLTFSATDEDGNVTFAASEIRTPGQVLQQDLSIYRRPFPGTATIRGIVKRSDTGAAVPFAQVGVYSQGYGLMDGFADSSGRFEFRKVPVGFITVLAAEWTLSRISTAIDFDLGANEVKDVTLTLDVKPAEALVVIDGDVLRENPLYPGDTTKYEKVAGAVVKLEKGQAVTADANGHFVFPSVPVSFSNKKITAYDPITTRSVTNTIQQLDPSRANTIPMFIATANGYGTGTIRVRVLDAAGYPVTGMRVIEPAYPPFVPKELVSKPDGIYLLENVPVGGITRIWAISAGGQYGDQAVTGTTKVEFNGHIASLNLRLPGQGTVRVKLHGDIDVIGDVKITYPAWEEADMNLAPKEITRSTSESGLAGYAAFAGVPALQDFTVSSQHPVYGYASQTAKIGFDGDVKSITLELNKLSTVRGVVYAIDGRTPVPGAAVRIEDGTQNPGIQYTLPDGSYEFRNVAAAKNFRVIAEITQDGTYRTGVASGTTPAVGGPVNGLSVILRTQGSIEGRIVYAGYKTFDPQNPANNVVDPTPNDLSDNAPVPLANFSLRELDFPYRSFGTLNDPISADVLGRFNINNVFTGPLRITAVDPGNQENRGTWTGAISQEGEKITALVGIGAEGFGPVVVRVLDPNAQNAPVLNAEVTLNKATYPYSKFDLTSTDSNGIAHFEQVPAGSYKVAAYSKALGKSGGSAAFTVANVTGASVDVVLEFSGRVDGTLTDPENAGRGVPGAPVTLTEEGFQTRASTDTAGAFVFQGVREGSFKLEAKDTLSNRRATATRNLTQIDPNPFVALQLEPIETLYLSVYLPNDSGGNSNVLAPLVNLEVKQRNEEFERVLQGNNFQMPGLFENESYSISIKELGGDQRTINTTNHFPVGSAGNPLKLVLPAYGSVQVNVTQAGQPAANAKVTVNGSSKIVTAYTDSSGTAILNGIPLGPVSVQVTTVDNAFSGSANGTLASQSTPAVIPVTLGAYAGISGLVDAETGGPSIGTRVIAQWGSRILEAFTDPTGRFTVQGIPTGSTVNLTYMGPDDVTVGARQPVVITAADASKIVEALKVKLDATPPQVATFFPADNASNVSPDSTIRITFTERIQPAYINSAHLQLLPADSAVPVSVSYSSTLNANGTFTVTMTPPAPPAGQVFPLKSNTLYRIVVSASVLDLTGNRIPAARGASFITSDYNEPKVLKVVPSPATAIQANTTFEFRFNEPIDPAPWQTGGGAALHFYKLNQFGENGTVVAEKAGRAYVDPSTGLSLFFAPNEPLEQESFYRIVFTGVRDLQGNALGQQIFHFFSYDQTKPFVTLVSPVPQGYPLISGVEYVQTLELRNGSAAGSLATDIAKVDYFRVDGTTQTYAYTATAAPWTYRYVAPDAPAGGSTFTMRAIATDLSGNESDPGDLTLQLKPNAAPQNVTVTLTPSTSIYPGNKVAAGVTFEDEGTQVTVQLEAAGVHADNTEYKTSQVRTVTRQKVNDAWPTTSFDFDLPATLKQGTRATFTATATDMRGLKGTGSAGLDLTADTIAPEILTLSPPAQSRYNIGQKFQIAVTVKDLETGVATVTFSFDNQTITVTRPSSKVTSLGSGQWLFTSGDITVPAKNVDTTIAITATARDYSDNVVSKSTEVVYVGVNDPTVPKGAWLCPVDKAVYPAGKTMPVKLQVRATDDISVTGVTFTVPGVATPITATRVGTSDVYETTATLTFPAAGETLTLSATISDANASHDITIPVILETVAVDVEIDNFPQPVTAADVANYTNKSVLVRGSLGRLVPHVPLTLKNLIVLDSALVDTLLTTTTTERRLDLTVTGRLYVDCSSSIDVTAHGYLGGYGANYDGSGTNSDTRGRTAGNVNTGGAVASSASHAGYGGVESTGTPNEPYGSITDPTDLGAGGGAASNNVAGASGGGAIKLQGGVFAIAGAIRADGGSRFNNGYAGAGGSVNIRSAQLITGPATRITANGGDDDQGNDVSRGGGGGRIAVYASERLDIESIGTQLQSRGGRNGTSTEGANYLDGGAGTIFVRRPSQTIGELFVGSYDERFPFSTHLTRPTPLAGTLNFDKLTLGKRALVRADAALTVNGIVDTKSAATIDVSAVLVLNGEVPALTMTTAPVAGSSLIQTTPLAVTYSATSNAGIGSVRHTFSPIAADRVDAYGSYPATAAPAAVNLTVPADAVPGNATLTLTATDRAGRSTQTATQSYTIVANTAVVLDAFDATPVSIYPGKSVTATVSAHDDVKVTRLTLTKTIGTGAPTTQVVTPNLQTVTNQTFTVPIDITTPGGQTMTLEIAAEDGYPGRVATKDTRVVQILKDTVAPVVSIIAPANNALFNEGTGNTIQVRTTITDADVGVKEAFAQILGAAAVTLTKSGSEYIASVPVPNVEGSEIVTKTLSITGKDYEGNTTTQSITIRIQPINDPNAPVVSWSCPTLGAMFPAGTVTRLLVYALGNGVGNAANGVQKVELFVDDATTPIVANAVSGQAGYYDAPFTIPAAAAANSTISIRAVVTNASGVSEQLTTQLTVIVADRTITADTTITAADFSYDNKTVVVQGGTTTILGPHTFTRLIVLANAKVTQAATDATTIQRLQINATSGIFVACDGSIDVSNKGFTGSAAGYGRTWPNTNTGGSYNGAGGSHGGRGGAHDANGDSAQTFGSVFDPNTPGGAGGYWQNGTCNPCNAGGGIARVSAPNVIVDGKLLSNGQSGGGTGTGAGGSIRVDAQTLSGGGEIRADGAPTYWAAGGGGRVALHYQSINMDRAKLSAAGGLHSGNATRTASAGTLYLRQLDPSGAKLADELIVGNLDRAANYTTPLPNLGTGTVTAVSGATVTLSAAVPEFVEGMTVDFLEASGAIRSTYQIASRTATSVTVQLGAGESAANAIVGNGYRGTWRFDLVTLQGRGSLEADALHTPAINSSTNALGKFNDLRGGDLVLSAGRTEVNRLLEANSLVLKNAGVLSHSATTSTTVNKLTVNVAGSFSVDATSSIDVSYLGLTGSTSGFGRTWPNTTTGGSYNGAGGSHGGRGGAHDTNGDSAATYGNVLDPSTPGGAGGYWQNGTCNPCNNGGGVARVKAGSFVLNGKVLANGQLSSGTGTGAGGSIKIEAGSISGTGEVHADGAPTYWAAGGGGRVALWYQTNTLDPLKISAAGGLHNGNATRTASAGTIYRRQVDANGNRVSDELVVDNLDRPSARPTTLPAIGTGSVTAVNGAVVTLSNAVPEWIEGSTIEFLDATGAVVSSYEIVSRTPTSVTVILPAGQSAANVSIGNAYRGMWTFEQVTAKRQGMLDMGSVRSPLVTTSGASYTRFEELRGTNVVLRGGLIETKKLVASTLSLENGAVLSHPATTSSAIYSLVVDVAGAITVDGTSSIDVSSKGFSGSTAGFGRTWPNTTTGGSQNGAGGSHGGRGGAHDANGDSGQTYGSLFDPNTPGGAGGYWQNGTCSPCNAGGGIARIKGGAFTLDGKILANGQLSSGTGTGAGGSIRIDATTLTGGGEIHADGAPTYWAAGGGGRVAVYYQTLGVPLTKITAAGGLHSGNTTRTGAAGTVFLKQAAQPYGDLVVDNIGRSTIKPTVLPSVAYRTVTETGTDFVKDSAASFLGPDHLAGIRAFVNHDPTKLWPIASNDDKTLRLDVSAQPFTATAGQSLRGLFKFDSVKLRNAKLDLYDVLDIATPLDKDAASSLVGANAGPPRVTASLIRLESTPTGAAVIGSASAVIDVDAPVTVYATNTNTGNVYTSTVNQTDGSFAIPVQGTAGDNITFKVRDGNVYYLESPVITIGALPTSTPVPSQINRTAWTTDTAFLSRTLSRDGATMAVASLPGANSDKLVLLSVADPAYPNLLRTVTTTGGAIRDVVLQNGWAYIGADRFMTLNLSDGTGTSIWASGANQCGSDTGVAVIDGLAFTAMNDCYTDGYINIYDVSTPGAAKWISTQAMSAGQGVAYTDLQILGSDYIVALSPSKTSGVTGHDVVVLDRKNLYGLRKVADIDIPAFDAFRGTIVGSTLYVVSQTTAKFVIVDLSNPAAPVVTGSVALPAVAGNVYVIGQNAFVAGGSAGLATIDISNPASPVLVGVTPVTGNAFDVNVAGNYAYVANEAGLALVPAQFPPQINTAKIGMSLAGTMVTITGQPQAVSGSMPVTVEITNVSTGAKIAGLAVQSDGSFTAQLPGTPNDAMTVKATDTYGRVNGPLSIGKVPFGSQARVLPVGSSITDTSFAARNVATSGNYLVVASNTYDGGSDKLVIYDATDRANPVYKRTVASGVGLVRDIAIAGDRLIVGGDRVGTLDLTSNSSVVVWATGANQCGSDYALEVAGGYVFAAMGDCYTDAYINVYEIATGSAARWINTESMAGANHAITGLSALGTDYLVAVSGHQNDLLVIDRRELYDLKRVIEFDIPNFTGVRVKVIGARAYVTGADGTTAVVDLTNPAVPVLVGTTGIVRTAGWGRSLDALGTTVAVADSTAGVSFLNASGAGLPTILGNQLIGGTAWECAFNGSTLYVANQIGLVVIDSLGTPPLIDTTLITTSSDGAGTATATGIAKAVLGHGPLTLELRNAASGMSQLVTVAIDGSFTATVPGAPGQPLTVKATDAIGRVSGPLSIGIVPFGASTSHFPIPNSMTDGVFMSRNLAVQGNDLVVSDYYNSDKLVLFDVSTPGQPVYKRTLASGVGVTHDFEIYNGWLIVGGDRVGTLDLSSNNSVVLWATGANQCGGDLGIEVAPGGIVFTAMSDCYTDGYINIYDVSTPSAPRWVSTQAVGGGNNNAFTDLALLGSNYLVGIGGSAHDVTIIDRRDLFALKFVRHFDLNNFEAFHGKVVGNTLYLTGIEDGVAVIDLTDPNNPVLQSVNTSLGSAVSVDAAGSMLAVANGMSGVSFLDASNPSATFIAGAHPLPGSTWEVALSRGAMYAVTEAGLASVSKIAVPPMIEEWQLTITPGATSTTVTGPAYAITGIGPLTVSLRNDATGVTSSPVAVAANGSFTATVTAAPGVPLSILATDAGGRVAIRGLGRTYGATTSVRANPAVTNDANFRARRVVSNGATTVVSTGMAYGFYPTTNKLMFFGADPTAPQIVNGGVSALQDIRIQGGYLYLGGERTGAIDLADPTLTTRINTGANQCGSDASLAVTGRYMYAAMNDCYSNAYINIYDLLNPATPLGNGTVAVGSFGSTTWRKLVGYGASYLVALTANTEGNVERDVVIIDRTNPGALVKVAELGLPGFEPIEAIIDGTTLYVTGLDNGVAIIDLANPLQPQLRSKIKTSGSARGLAMSGPNELVVADMAAGITFVNVTDKANPVVTGSQKLPGTAVAVEVVGKNIHVAAENHYHLIQRP